MAFIDFFKKNKNKKERGLKHPKKESLRDKPKKKVAQKTSGSAANVGAKMNLKESNVAWRVLKEPHVTEKSTDLTAKNHYVFKVFKNSVKKDIKRAIEEVYGVKVVGVRKIAVPGKKRRRGAQIGRKPGYAKAIIALKEGNKIEVLPH